MRLARWEGQVIPPVERLWPRNAVAAQRTQGGMGEGREGVECMYKVGCCTGTAAGSLQYRTVQYLPSTSAATTTLLSLVTEALHQQLTSMARRPHDTHTPRVKSGAAWA